VNPKKKLYKSFKFKYTHTFHHLMEAMGFCFKFFLLQYLKEVKVSNSCIWLCDLMFCNTYILLCGLFMSKVLKLRFFYYKVKIFFFYSFWSRFEVLNRPCFLAIDNPCPPNMVWKDKKWMKAKSKWKCKVSTCIVVYSTKWLLTKHSKEVHGLMVEKAKHRRLSIFEKCI